MTVAAMSEFSAVSGTTEKPQHWLDQVTLEGDARRAFLARTLKELHPDDFLDWMNSNKKEGGEPQTWESAARNVGNWEIIALMREKLFGDENKNNLPEFLMSGISLDLQDQSFRQTLLMGECSGSGKAKSEEKYRAERLVEALSYYWVSIDPSLRDSDGETIYTLAAQNGRVEVLDVLAFYTDSTPRNARKESPLCLLLSADYSAAPPSTVKSCLDRLIGSHDFAGMPKKGPESFEEMSSAFKKLCERGIQDNDKGRSFMYLDALAHFSHANNQYHREETAQLKAQLAAAQARLGREEVPALLLPPSPQS